MEDKDRRTFIGSSDAAALLHVSPFKTAGDVWRSKVGLTSYYPPDPGRAKVLSRGQRLEPYVLAMLNDERGIKAVRRNVRYIDPEFPFLAAEIDAEAEDGRNIEVKTVSLWKMREWGEQGTDELPLHYVAQVQHQMMIKPADVTIVPVLFGGDDFKVYEVPRDPVLIARIRAIEIEFWETYVVPRKPPPPENLEDVEKLFPRDRGGVIQCPEYMLPVWEKLRHVRQEMKLAEQVAEECETKLKEMMADAAILEWNGATLATWKTQVSKRVDVAALRLELPDVAAKFLRDSPSRVFRIK